MTAEQILHEIDTLPQQEKDTLLFLLDKEAEDEILRRKNLDRSLDIDEDELFNN